MRKNIIILASVLLLSMAIYALVRVGKPLVNEQINKTMDYQVTYTNAIAQICSKNKNTAEQNIYLLQGSLAVDFKSNYSVLDISNFLKKNKYQIKGEVYSNLGGPQNGTYGVVLLVPAGEEYCWMRELKKEADIKMVSGFSTLAPD